MHPPSESDRETASAPRQIRELALPYIPVRPLLLRIDLELAARLRQAGRARREPPERLAEELLVSGLEREARRSRFEAALDQLTPREREIVQLIALGLTNMEIAETLVISVETVKSHVRNSLGKFGAESKAELRLWLMEIGSREPNPP